MKKLTNVLSQALMMGGYARYVWPAFAIAVIGMLIMTALSVRALRRAQRMLAQLQQPPRDEA